MPFLLPAIPALAAGAVSSGAAAGANALLSGGKNAGGFQSQGFNMGNLNNAQSSVLDTEQRQREFLDALQLQQGGMGAQNQLAQQLMMQAQGGGPNPALAQLANTTGQNISNQAALMGSQRGVGANPGLMARNIAQMGAAQQQQAGGQAAALRAQQQLAAQQQLQALAGQQVAQQQGALGALSQVGLENQGQIANMMSNMNAANAGIAKGNQVGAQQIAGGLAQGVAPGLLTAFAGKRDETQNKAYGGEIQSHAGYFKGGGKVPGKAEVKGDSLKNDKVPALLSPGEIVIPRSKVNDPEKAKAFVDAILAKKRLS